MTNINRKVIFSRWIRNALLFQGEELIETQVNRDNPSFQVYIFKYSDTLDESIKYGAVVNDVIPSIAKSISFR